MINNQYKKRALLILVIFTLVCGLVWKDKTAPVSEYVLSQISNCYDTGKKNTCYKSLAETLVEKYKLKEVFTVLESHENDPKIFEACHEVLHFMGQAEYARTNNLSSSMGQGNPVCFAGYFHGVLEAYMSSQKINIGEETSVVWLKENIPLLCSGKVSQKILNECLHGLGHALMYATDSNLPASLELCDVLSTGAQREWCYSGAFMENSTSSTNPDHPNQYLDKKNPMYPCNILEKKYLNMCYTLQSFYFAKISDYDWKKTMALCNQVPADYRYGCYHAIGQSQVGGVQEYSAMEKVCAFAQNPEYYRSCLSGVVGALVERYGDGVKKASGFCGILQDKGQSYCFQSIINLMRQYSSNENLTEICNDLKESPYFKQQCLTQLGSKE